MIWCTAKSERVKHAVQSAKATDTGQSCGGPGQKVPTADRMLVL